MHNLDFPITHSKNYLMKSNRSKFHLLLITSFLLLLSACKPQGDAGKEDLTKENKKETATLVPVEVGQANRQLMKASYTGTTTLVADREAQVVAKTSGVLMKLFVEEGDKVKAGQMLAKLDEESPRLNVVKAEAMLKKLENDYRRANELFDKKLLSSEDHDKIGFDLDTQRAAYDLAKLELSYTRITAPIDGVISQRMVKEGNLIQENQTLFKIDDFDPLLGVLNVPERELNTLKAGQIAAMTVDALTGQKFEGKISRISPVVDAASGTFRVTCEFRDKSEKLKSGMFGRLEITYDQRMDALTIPRAALIEEDGENAVFVVEPPAPTDVANNSKDKTQDKKEDKPDNKPVIPADALAAHRRLVKIGYIDGDKVEIREGLNEGAKVITVGRAAVRDGTLVQVLEAKP